MIFGRSARSGWTSERFNIYRENVGWVKAAAHRAACKPNSVLFVGFINHAAQLRDWF